MPDRPFPSPRPVAPLLGADLDRARHEAWFDAAERAYGGAAECWPLVLVGRLVRAGLLSAVTRRAIRAWLRDPVDSPAASAAFWNHEAQELEGQLAGVERWIKTISGDRAPRDDSTGWAAIAARDDVESALWVLGRAALEVEDVGAVSAERRVLLAANSVDTLALSHYHGVSDALRASRLAGPVADWLKRAATAESASWWLDLVFEHMSAEPGAREHLRTQVSGRPLPSLARGPLRLGKGPGLAARAREADVVGCDLSLDQLRAGRVVARMFDGDVEVLVRGIADSDPAPAGLLVRVRAGAPGRIEAVTIEAVRIEAVALDPVTDASVSPHSIEPHSIENDWWVPWTGHGPAKSMLRVRFSRPSAPEGAEECLAIECG